MKRTTGRRQWNSAVSGTALKKLREREELSRREVAEHLSGVLGRPVATSHIAEMEGGAEPSQEVFGHLLDLYMVAGVDDHLLYPLTDSAAEQQQEHEQRRADLAKRVAALGPEDEPVRFRR
jgi:hypothetical protein